jgi:23S rRNA pseudouridine2605 synthase
LLLLTNDGALSRQLELPATGWLRRYRVRVHGGVSQDKIKRLADGLVVERVKYGPIEAAIDSVQRSNTWLSMSLREGKNREIRRVMEALDLPVTRLIRVAYGPFQLGTLPRGAVEEVNGKVLREQVPGLSK